VTSEVKRLRGRAELELKLRAREVFYNREQILVPLSLVNHGQSFAENVTVELQSRADFQILGETQCLIGKVQPTQTIDAEFTIRPMEDCVHLRLEFQIRYDDAEQTSKSLPYVDELQLARPQRPFIPVESSPYVVGVPVIPGRSTSFVGRHDLIDWVEQQLLGSQKVVLVLYGQRRTGKSSLLYQLAEGSVAQSLREHPERPIYPVYIDLQRLTDRGTDLFLTSITESIAGALRKRGLACPTPVEADFARAPYRTFNQYLDAVEAILGTGMLVLMLDEFEELEERVSDGKVDKDIFSQFRSQMQRLNAITFILTGTHRLEELSRDYQSIIFNVALHREVTFLNRSETVDLIRTPVASQVYYDDLSVDKLWRVTHGHPYFVQLLCQDIILDMNRRCESNFINIADVNDAVGRLLTRGGQEMNYMWDRSSLVEQAVLATMAELVNAGQEYVTQTQIASYLRSAGLTDTDLTTATEHLVARRLLEPYTGTSNASEATFAYSFDLLRLWVLRYHRSGTILPRLENHR
jgi:GTPase SAR1 family protein